MRSAATLVSILGLFAFACAEDSTVGPVSSAGAAGIAGASAGSAGQGGIPAAAGTPAVSGQGGGGAGAGDVSGSAGSGTSGGGAGGGGAGGTAGSAGAAGAGGNGGNGGMGPSPYKPCPTNGEACKIMPLGDSITDGCCGENVITKGGSYRVELFHLSLVNNKKITFVGSGNSGPPDIDGGVAFPKKHEGHSGWTIEDGNGREGLQKNIVSWLNNAKPHIVTLMIGTNDVGVNLDLPNAPKRLAKLVDTIAQTTPSALIVLAQIVPSKQDDFNKKVETFNAAMPALVKTATDAGKHVVLVDMYSAYTKVPNYKNTQMANDLHPSDAGYNTMAHVWWPAISDLLPPK